LDIKDLVVFHEVAEEGNLSRAARNLNYVQSNVTMKIKQLEKELGTPLFYRNGKGMVLNESGEILLPYAKQIIQLVNQSVRSVQRHANEPTGRMKIGSTESTAAVHLPAIFTEYCKKYPEVEVILETHTSDELIQLVLERKLEGAFIAGETQHPDLKSVIFTEEQLVLISKSPLSSVEELNGNSLLVFSKGCSYRKRLESWMQKEKLVPKRILEFGTIEAIIGCVKAGLGTAAVIRSLVTDKKTGCETVLLPAEICNVPTTFITRKDAVVSAALRTFVQFVRR
jgi:DNA-binding transcriptional LysR family regulator